MEMPLHFQQEKLIEIANLIHEYFPEIECIACYASIRNIKPKSLKDLKKLRDMGFNRLYIGLIHLFGLLFQKCVEIVKRIVIGQL